MNLRKARANETRLTVAGAARSEIALAAPMPHGALPQIEGGARALGWKCGAVADASSGRGRRVTKSTDAGSGKSGATESVEVPARLINAQIGQSKSANPFREGSRELDPSDAAAADDNAVSAAVGTNE